MSGFKVENRTSESVQCSITNTTGGNAEWFNVAPGCNDTWKRAGWEDVKFRDPADTKFKSLRANRGEPAIIYFDGFDKPLTIVNTYQPAGFRVNNKSPQTVMVSVTSTTGGDNALFKLVPGQSDVWRRNGSETIRVQTEDGSKHAEGVFDNKGKMADVNFVDFSYSLVFRTGNANYIADEHYAEAARIAGSYYDKTQALDSHLTLAIPKVDALERAVHGRNESIGDFSQIDRLALVINCVNFGEPGPAVVVGANSEWIKVAAYCRVSDNMALLGFPARVMNQISPGNSTPVVGSRLLALSTFVNDANAPGDVIPGPRCSTRDYHILPLIAQFVTEDTCSSKWHDLMNQIDETSWSRVDECWSEWKTRHGENTFRLGAPSRYRERAAGHGSM